MPSDLDRRFRNVSRVLVSTLPSARIVTHVLTMLAAATIASAATQDVPYGIGDWPEALGNHRARVRVEQPADAVWVHLPWRRRDAAPERIDIIVMDAATNQRVENVLRGERPAAVWRSAVSARHRARRVFRLLPALQDRRLVVLSDHGLPAAEQHRAAGLGGRLPAPRRAAAFREHGGSARRAGARVPGDQRVPSLRSDGSRGLGRGDASRCWQPIPAGLTCCFPRTASIRSA